MPINAKFPSNRVFPANHFPLAGIVVIFHDFFNDKRQCHIPSIEKAEIFVL